MKYAKELPKWPGWYPVKFRYRGEVQYAVIEVFQAVGYDHMTFGHIPHIPNFAQLFEVTVDIWKRRQAKAEGKVWVFQLLGFGPRLLLEEI